jgi:transcriptional regulator GlxA family with amidase domain
MLTALVVYDGVLDDECEAFRSVLGLLEDARVVTVGAERRPYQGPGGTQRPDATFDEIDHVDVVVVPGGIGCERATDDAALRDFLRRMERQARLIVASSTGTVVLASAGLLHGESAATHWLASDLLRRHGSEADERRLVVSGNVITCEGRISAVDAAFAVVERVEGSVAVDRIRAMLLEHGQPLLQIPPWYDRLAERFLGRPTLRRPKRPPRIPGTAPSKPPVTPYSVMVELIEDDATMQRLKRAQRRRER